MKIRSPCKRRRLDVLRSNGLVVRMAQELCVAASQKESMLSLLQVLNSII